MQVAESPGIDEMNSMLRSTVRTCTLDEFKKGRFPFGSTWCSGPKHFPEFMLEGLINLIHERGGYEAMLVTSEEEARALDAAISSGEADGKNLQFWKPKYAGDLDADTPLYKTLNICLDIITWGTRKAPLEDWPDFLARLHKIEAWQSQEQTRDWQAPAARIS